MRFTKTSLASAILLASNTLAIELDLNDTESVKNAAKTVASSIVDLYGNASIPGLFGKPYYFWESGLAWDSLLHYWYQTGDDSHNAIISEALRFQLGPDNNYSPPNQTMSLGNDDQATWALAAMTAAEYGFPTDVLDGLNTTWAQIAVNVFEDQAARWDEKTCGGGLRWQIFTFNAGYDYKNTMSNGDFYQLASRLALYTGNTTYADWSRRVYEWTFEVGLISDSGAVYDGSETTQDCETINHIQWTANAGTYLAGEAYAYNASPAAWSKAYIPSTLSILSTFAASSSQNGTSTLTEVACAPNNNCNTDQLSFRAILARALAQTLYLTSDPEIRAPSNSSSSSSSSSSNSSSLFSSSSSSSSSIYQRISSLLSTSALGAAAQCSGGEKGTTCGSDWGAEEWDGTQGLGQDLSALNIFLANLPIEGKLATANGSASGGAGGAGGSGGSGSGSGSGGGNGSDGTADAAASEGAAGHVTVVSSLILVAAGVGSVMAFL